MKELLFMLGVPTDVQILVTTSMPSRHHFNSGTTPLTRVRAVCCKMLQLDPHGMPFAITSLAFWIHQLARWPNG